MSLSHTVIINTQVKRKCDTHYLLQQAVTQRLKHHMYTIKWFVVVKKHNCYDNKDPHQQDSITNTFSSSIRGHLLDKSL